MAIVVSAYIFKFLWNFVVFCFTSNSRTYRWLIITIPGINGLLGFSSLSSTELVDVSVASFSEATTFNFIICTCMSSRDYFWGKSKC